MIVKDFFEDIGKLKIMVIGDVMIDRYLTGKVNRISPEAPVPVVAQVEMEDRLGGAANVALNIQALGAHPILCGVVGKDADSSAFFGLLEKAGLTDKAMSCSEKRNTTVKTRIIAERQHLLRLDKENTEDLDENEERQFLSVVNKLFDYEKIDALILQDYNKGVLTRNVIESVLALAKKKNIPVAVDPKFRNFWTFKEVDLFKPNLRETQDALKRNIHPDVDSLNEAANKLNQKLNNRSTLITLSEHGVFYHENGKSYLVPTRPRKVADVCGAGDAVISMAAIGLAMGLDMGEIAMLSNLVGGQIVERLGVVPIDRKQLEMELMDEILS